jgi:hypothetical protein
MLQFAPAQPFAHEQLPLSLEMLVSVTLPWVLFPIAVAFTTKLPFVKKPPPK